MSTFFQTPDVSAINAAESGGNFLKQIHYAALKTAESYARYAQGDTITDAIAKGKLGFSLYDKENRVAVPIEKFQFILLEVYSCITGDNGESGDSRISYFSNRVKDSRVDEYRVFQSALPKPRLIASGIYKEFKDTLPKGAGWQAMAVVLNLSDNIVYELPLTAALTRGLQHALADSAIAAGKKNAIWEKMQILGLADNDHLWGFQFTEFVAETKEGIPYAGKGDLYFSPRFACGVVQPLGNTVELHKIAVAAQNDVRADYLAKKARDAKYATGNTTQQPAAQPAPQQQQTQHAPQQQQQQAGSWWGNTGGFANENNVAGDDLPF